MALHSKASSEWGADWLVSLIEAVVVLFVSIVRCEDQFKALVRNPGLPALLLCHIQEEFAIRTHCVGADEANLRKKEFRCSEGRLSVGLEGIIPPRGNPLSLSNFLRLGSAAAESKIRARRIVEAAKALEKVVF